jgi:hypothetical protein
MLTICVDDNLPKHIGSLANAMTKILGIHDIVDESLHIRVEQNPREMIINNGGMQTLRNRGRVIVGMRHPMIMLLSTQETIISQIEVLGHEMIHIDQLVKGRVEIFKDGEFVRWMNKIYSAAMLETIPYEDWPWEQEAIDGAPLLATAAFRAVSTETRSTILTAGIRQMNRFMFG